MTASSPRRVSVILPVYNQGASLVANVKSLERMLETITDDFEIIISEDGSSDGSHAIASSLGSGRIAILHSDERLGKGRAIRKAAEVARFDHVLFMDADLSSNLSSLNELISMLEDGASLVIGSRYHPSSKTSRTFTRHFASRGYNLLVGALLGSRFSDHQCGFKAFDRNRILPLIQDIRDPDWFWDTELIVLSQRRGLEVREIPVVWSEGKTSSFSLLRDSWHMARSLVRFRLGI